MLRNEMKRVIIVLGFMILLFGSFCSVYSDSDLLTLKWHPALPIKYGCFHPCLGDVDNDRTKEIVFKYGYCVQVLDGKTGAVEWLCLPLFDSPSVFGSHLTLFSAMNGSTTWEISLLEFGALSWDGLLFSSAVSDVAFL